MLNVEGIANLHDVSANHMNLAGTITGHDANLNDVILTGTIRGNNAILNDISAQDVTLSGTIAGHDAVLNDVTMNGDVNITGTMTGQDAILNDISCNGNIDISGNITGKDAFLNNINMGGAIVTDNGVYSNFKIEVIPNTNLSDGVVMLLCLKDGGDNECVGRMYYQRSSGHDGSGIVDIVVSSRSATGDTPNGFCSYQTNQENSNSGTPHKFSIISGTFSGVDYIGIKYEGGDAFPFSDIYFDGILKTTGTNEPFDMKLNSEVSNQSVLSLNNSELSLQNKSLVIDNNEDVSIKNNLIINENTTSSTADITTLTNSKITSTDRIIINNTKPTLYLKDTNHRSGMIHMNNNIMYFLSGETNTETWTQVGGQWPLYLQTDTNQAVFGGGITFPGNLTSSKFRAFKPVDNLTNRFPSSSSATLTTIANNVACNGGTLMFHCEVGGFNKTSGALNAEYQIRYTDSGGTIRANIPLKFFFNQASVHQAWSRTHVQSGVPAANMKLELWRNNTDLVCDPNDYINVTMMELPF